jgi:hypothetical protein
MSQLSMVSTLWFHIYVVSGVGCCSISKLLHQSKLWDISYKTLCFENLDSHVVSLSNTKTTNLYFYFYTKKYYLSNRYILKGEIKAGNKQNRLSKNVIDFCVQCIVSVLHLQNMKHVYTSSIMLIKLDTASHQVLVIHSAAVLTGNHLKLKSPMPILFLRMSLLGYITKVLYNSTLDDYGHS